MSNRMSKRVSFCLLCAMVIVAQTGCGRYSHVNWFNPGRTDQQVGRALLEHDPYPDQNLGPDVVGGRPLGFTTPPPEPIWVQERFQVQQLQSQTIVNQPSYNLPPVYIPPATNPAPTTPNYTLPPYQQYQQPTQQLFPQQPLMPPRY